MKILGPNETGKGILIEYDAGYINPKSQNNHYIMESQNFLDHSKPFEFYAVLQKYDTPNRNGRVYPEKILKREAENYKKMIEKGTSLSELNHPESSLIDLDRVSHMITEVWWDGPVLLGKLNIRPDFNNIENHVENHVDNKLVFKNIDNNEFLKILDNAITFLNNNFNNILHSEILNIKDEILAEIDKAKYLLSFI
jgi:hypothetical protein